MDKALLNGLMVENIMENGLMENNMVKGNIFFQMEMLKLVDGKMDRGWIGFNLDINKK